ncbi:methionine ABC transporter ATP-binding protein [Candidatus Chlamydia sanziniae]|uniref:Methionine ABC transporter ATP-binding protein n=1 Tax=Candidatus Chlamydia sanziniae TaxID=1806891 RepID=A0A1A9HW08_9CHLA|nr:methionine ABC transporter ATP-binding protein [Candidatus Chlamydia sanziniae]ANH79025.1 Methionine ABC transporter ATP-binding protein [Candidatus Chlamydia sanziniae]
MLKEHSAIISVANLSKTLGLHSLLKEVSFSVYSGEIFGIIGHSGSGKTTLLRCLDFLEFPTTGSITIAGFQSSLAVKKMSRSNFAKKVAYISQNYGLFSAKTVFQNIAYPLHVHNSHMLQEEVHERVLETLNFLNLYHKKDVYPGNLSGGQKQKVAIARAIICEPQVLLCDEITSALDPKSTEDIIEKFLKLNDERKVTLVLVSHEIDIIKKICSRTLVMHQGVIEELGATEQLFLTPQSPLTEGLFDRVSQDFSFLYKNRNYTELLRLGFPKELAAQGIVSEIIQTGIVSINILSGRIDLFRNTPMGFLIVDLEGSLENRRQAKIVLTERGVLIKELNCR